MTLRRVAGGIVWVARRVAPLWASRSTSASAFDGADVLRVAASHLGCLRADLDELAAGQLRCFPALRANAHRHLIRGSPVVRRTAEEVTGHQEHDGVVVELELTPAAELGGGFSKGGQRFCRNLQAQDMAPLLRIGGRIGRVSRASAVDHRFDLTNGLALRGLQPLLLGLGHGHARELAHRRPAHGAGGEGLGGLRQLLEGLGYPELLLRRARRKSATTGTDPSFPVGFRRWRAPRNRLGSVHKRRVCRRWSGQPFTSSTPDRLRISSRVTGKSSNRHRSRLLCRSEDFRP